MIKELFKDQKYGHEKVFHKETNLAFKDQKFQFTLLCLISGEDRRPLNCFHMIF